MDYIQIQVTFPVISEANGIADRLVRRRLVACAQVCRDVQSTYFWEGRFESGEEVLLLAKTKMSLFERVVSTIREFHSYVCPQIIALPIVAVNADYGKWMDEQLIADE